jgi:hypothetical protein
MPETHTVGRAFWHRIRLRTDAPRHHRFITYEYEPPFRSSDSHIFRVARNFGLVVGLWGPPMDEDEANMSAVQGHVVVTNEEVTSMPVEMIPL